MASEIKVIEELCTGCALCPKVCPVNCIEMKSSEQARTQTLGKLPWKTLAVIDVDICIFCGACVKVCDDLRDKFPKKDRFKAIVMTKEEAAATLDLTQHKGVWSYAEQRHGVLVPTIFELLYIGKQLAKTLNEELSAVLIGHNVKGYAQEIIEHGADKVYVLDHPVLENFVDETYAQVFTKLILKEKPNKLLMPASTIGRSFASRVAIMANTGITADATELSIGFNADGAQKGLLHATRPSFGGNLMATILCEKHRPEMATVRPMSFPRSQREAGRKGEIIEVPIDIAQSTTRTKFIEFVPEKSQELDIASAEKIVSGGRGIGRSEGFEVIRSLAKTLNAAVGASRAAVDAGWITYRHQVGLTGRTVRPKLYIACGISGQIQHLAGMGQSEVIVCINKDPEAPLMNLATFSIEADLHEFVPLLVKEIQKQRG